MPLPNLQITRTDAPAPLEGQDVSEGTGFRAGVNSSMMSTLGISLEAKAIGALRGGSLIDHKQAADYMTQQGYDPSVLPAGDVTEGTLTTLANQQSAIRRGQDLQNRAHMSGFTAGAANLTGSFLDPIFLAAGPVAGRVFGAAQGASLAARAATGGAEGAGVMGAYDVGRKTLGTAPGDHDLDAYTMAHDAAVGAIFGGGVHAAFGPRVTPETIANLERSSAAAKLQGIAMKDVVSPAGAIGEYQIMPETGRALGFTPAQLHDPAINRQASQMLLDQLSRRYGNDPEAIAIAYNAGPRRADKWLAAGRDDAALPGETRGYVERLRQQPGYEANARQNFTPVASHLDAARAAVTHSEADLNPDVATAVDAANERAYTSRSALTIADEHDADVRDLETQAYNNVGNKLRSVFDRPDVDEMSRSVEAEGADHQGPTSEKGPLVTEEERHADVVKQAQVQAEVPTFEPRKTVSGEEPEFTPKPDELAENFKADMAKHDELDAEADDFNKGVEAAVRCSLNRGL